MAVIEVNNLTKDYGHQRGVFNVSFEIQQGECFGFLGPNGAGKSTTIRHILGFSKPNEGITKINGLETHKNYSKVLKNVGYIPGEIALPAGLTGYEFIKMQQDLKHIYNDELLKELYDIFDLRDNVLRGNTKTMSLGIKRKLAIVSAFMSDPDILILDEPTSGLDPVMQERFIRYLKEQKEKGKTILLSSHIFNEVDATCDRISIIKDGYIVDSFNADELKHKSTKFYYVDFSSKEDYENFIKDSVAIPSIHYLLENPSINHVDFTINEKDTNELISIISKYNVKSFVNKRETLENYFMKFYHEDKDFGGAL